MSHEKRQKGVDQAEEEAHQEAQEPEAVEQVDDDLIEVTVDSDGHSHNGIIVPRGTKIMVTKQQAEWLADNEII